MGNERGKNGVIFGLIAIIVLLIVALILVYTGTFSRSSNNETSTKNSVNSNTIVENKQEQYSYENVKGLYAVSSTSLDDAICLYENGTFSYVFGSESPFINLGNYLIEDNKLTLNYWMQLGEQVENYKTLNEVGTITINENGTLTLNRKPGNSNQTNIQLSKLEGQEAEKLLASKVFDIPYILDNVFELVR